MKAGGWLLLAAFVVLAVGGGAVLTSVVPGTTDIVQQFADAIATAEGFFVAGSKSQRSNNPGDIESNGQIIQYATADDGWAALYHQVYLMFYGGSQNYNPSMTIGQIGYIYADGLHDPTGAANWSANVAAALGVTTDTTLQALMS